MRADVGFSNCPLTSGQKEESISNGWCPGWSPDFISVDLVGLSYSQAVLWPQASPLWAQFPAL